MQQAYAANSAMSVMLMAFAEPHKNNDYAAGKEPIEVAVHRQVAGHYGAAFINLSQEVYDRIEAGELSWQYDFKDLDRRHMDRSCTTSRSGSCWKIRI